MLGPELGPEPPDVDVDGSRPSVEVVAPDLPQQLRAREDAPGMLSEETQQLELLVGEVDGPAARGHAVGLDVDRDGPEAHHPLPGLPEARPEHVDPEPELVLARLGVDEVVGDGRPRVEIELVPAEHHHDGDGGRVEDAEEAEAPVGVADGVGQHQIGGEVGDPPEPVRIERLGFHVRAEGPCSGEDLVGAAVGEEEQPSHPSERSTAFLAAGGYPSGVISRLLSSRYADPRPFRTTTEDGVQLVGAVVGDGPASLVFCHGFMGWHRKATVVRFVERMGAWFRVYVFDARGHGASGGRCTFGDREYLDVDAVVRLARTDRTAPLATIGASMGGIAVLRQAGLRGGTDAVMSVSTPARWDGHGTDAVRRMQQLTTTRWGRVAMRSIGLRLIDSWDWPEEPEDVVGKIAPTPLIVVHGRDDHYFSEEEAWRLYARAEQPKRLMLASRFGHAEDGFTEAFSRLAARRLYEALDLPWRG